MRTLTFAVIVLSIFLPLITLGQLDVPKGGDIAGKGDVLKGGGAAKGDAAGAADIIPIPFGGRILGAVPCPPRVALLLVVLTLKGPLPLVVEPPGTRIYMFGSFLPGNVVMGTHGTIPTYCVYPFATIPALKVKMIGTSLIPKPL